MNKPNSSLQSTFKKQMSAFFVAHTKLLVDFTPLFALCFLKICVYFAKIGAEKAD